MLRSGCRPTLSELHVGLTGRGVVRAVGVGEKRGTLGPRGGSVRVPSGIRLGCWHAVPLSSPAEASRAARVVGRKRGGARSGERHSPSEQVLRSGQSESHISLIEIALPTACRSRNLTKSNYNEVSVELFARYRRYTQVFSPFFVHFFVLSFVSSMNHK